MLTCDGPCRGVLVEPVGYELPGVGTGGLVAWDQPDLSSSSGCLGMRSSGVEISKSSRVRGSPRRARDRSPLGLHDSSPARHWL